MKRKFILLPTIMASALTPVAVATSCTTNNAIELNLTKLWSNNTLYRIYTEKTYNFVEDKKYVANIDISKVLSKTPTVNSVFVLTQHPTTMGHQTSTPICKPCVWVDNKKLVQVTKDSDKALNTFWLTIDLEKYEWFIEIYVGTIQKSSKVKIEFEADKTVEDYYPSLVIQCKEDN